MDKIELKSFKGVCRGCSARVFTEMKEQAHLAIDLQAEVKRLKNQLDYAIWLNDLVFVNPEWGIGDRVTKVKGSSWTGKVVGYYSTSLTPRGYAVESENEKGSVQIYPESALTEAE